MSGERIIPLAGGRFGILTVPAATATARPPAVVLINVGVVHRVGPFRQQVQLARQLAAAGHPVFRFDLPGIGDAALSATSPAQVIDDVFDRLDRELGSQGFIVGGICAAADLGWMAAHADPRVRGLLLIDGIARPGRWFRIGQLRLLLTRPPRDWLRIVRRQLSPRDAPGEADYRYWPDAGDEPVQLAAMLGRGVRVLGIYTGGAAHYFVHPRQFDATFGSAARHPLACFEWWRDVDHLFMAGADRRRLHDRVVDWCKSVKPL